MERSVRSSSLSILQHFYLIKDPPSCHANSLRARCVDWAKNHHSKATYHASYNTLVLFTVTTTSAHFVTTVSPHAKQQRLAYNGWWQSSWIPKNDEQLDEVLLDEERRRCLTHTQMQVEIP